MTSLHRLASTLHPGGTVHLSMIRDAMVALSQYQDAVRSGAEIRRGEAALDLQTKMAGLPQSWYVLLRHLKSRASPVNVGVGFGGPA